MTSRTRNTTLWIVALLGLALLPMPEALAQSASALRRENDALRAQVNELQAELKAARDTINDLQATIARLEAKLERRDAGRNGAPEPPPQPEKITIDESKPDASPRALLNAMQKGYSEAIGDREMGEPNTPDRNSYLAAVQRWARAANRQNRGQIQWHVVVEAAEPGPRNNVALTLRAIDPVTEVILGDPFRAIVDNRTLIRRIDRLARENRLIDQQFVIKGVLEPQVRVNPNRQTPGTFNNPPLIGPFAEFDFFVDVRVLNEPEPEQQDQPQRGG